MHQTPYGGQAPPGPTGELTVLSGPLAALLLREGVWEGNEGRR